MQPQSSKSNKTQGSCLISHRYYMLGYLRNDVCGAVVHVGFTDIFPFMACCTIISSQRAIHSERVIVEMGESIGDVIVMCTSGCGIVAFQVFS